MKVLKTDATKFKTCEILLVKPTNVAKGVTIAIIYRPPKGHIPDFIAEVNDLICSGALGDSFIICGDLNCPGPVNTRGLINNELKHMIEEQNLTQHVQEATCRTGNILDHILTSSDVKIVRNVSIHDVGLSDHSLITCKITETVLRAPPVQYTFRCWKRLDVDQFRARVSSSSSYRDPAVTADSFAHQLKNDVTAVLDDLLPQHVITRRVGKSRSCLSEEAVMAKQERRKLERRWKSTGFESVRIAYRKACKVANDLIKKSLSAVYTRRVQETSRDPRMLWRTVKNILHTSPSRYSQDGLCNSFASHIKEKIDKVRLSVVNSIGRTSSSQYSRSSENTLDLFSAATVEEVTRIIKRLPNKTSPLDYLHTSVLKSCVDVFAPLITRLVNLSFSEGCFPDQFKQAQVTPLIKKAGLDETDPSNYRPISNLNTIGKIIERVCLARILPHVASTGNFSPLQSAYRKSHSTETALLKILDDLYRVVDGKSAAVLIGLDLSAAFDTVDHAILIERLRQVFGISGTALAWVNSYLTSRTQFIKVGSEQSSTTPVSVGVP
ncbi:MAG: reverse transcriptase domain-containing protein, partial [Nitrososphaera sp.]|nr:reverse transcriptase domain-containing protein [Nitrososphaera sp.]